LLRSKFDHLIKLFIGQNRGPTRRSVWEPVELRVFPVHLCCLCINSEKSSEFS
jgi:hypothetical protein